MNLIIDFVKRKVDDSSGVRPEDARSAVLGACCMLWLCLIVSDYRNVESKARGGADVCEMFGAPVEGRRPQLAVVLYDTQAVP